MFGGVFFGGGEGSGRGRAAGVSVHVTVVQVTMSRKSPSKLKQMKEKACEDVTVQIRYKWSLRKNPMRQAKRFQELKLWSEPTRPSEERPWLSRLFPDRFEGRRKRLVRFRAVFENCCTLQNETYLRRVRWRRRLNQAVSSLKMSHIFHGVQFCVDFASSLLSFKEKQEIRRNIVDNGGTLSYILTKQVQLTLI